MYLAHLEERNAPAGRVVLATDMIYKLGVIRRNRKVISLFWRNCLWSQAVSVVFPTIAEISFRSCIRNQATCSTKSAASCDQNGFGVTLWTFAAENNASTQSDKWLEPDTALSWQLVNCVISELDTFSTSKATWRITTVVLANSQASQT